MSGLTIGRQIDLVVDGEEVVTLALRVELRRELLGRDLGAGDVPDLLMGLVEDVLLHSGFN